MKLDLPTDENTLRPAATMAAEAKLHSALRFIDKVRLVYKENPNVLSEFMAVMRAFKANGSYDKASVANSIKNLFSDKPLLVVEFAEFLPVQYHPLLLSDTKQTAAPSHVQVHTSAWRVVAPRGSAFSPNVAPGNDGNSTDSEAPKEDTYPSTDVRTSSPNPLITPEESPAMHPKTKEHTYLASRSPTTSSSPSPLPLANQGPMSRRSSSSSSPSSEGLSPPCSPILLEEANYGKGILHHSKGMLLDSDLVMEDELRLLKYFDQQLKGPRPNNTSTSSNSSDAITSSTCSDTTTSNPTSTSSCATDPPLSLNLHDLTCWVSLFKSKAQGALRLSQAQTLALLLKVEFESTPVILEAILGAIQEFLDKHEPLILQNKLGDFPSKDYPSLYFSDLWTVVVARLSMLCRYDHTLSDGFKEVFFQSKESQGFVSQFSKSINKSKKRKRITDDHHKTTKRSKRNSSSTPILSDNPNVNTNMHHKDEPEEDEYDVNDEDPCSLMQQHIGLLQKKVDSLTWEKSRKKIMLFKTDNQQQMQGSYEDLEIFWNIKLYLLTKYPNKTLEEHKSEDPALLQQTNEQWKVVLKMLSLQSMGVINKQSLISLLKPMFCLDDGNSVKCGPLLFSGSDLFLRLCKFLDVTE